MTYSGWSMNGVPVPRDDDYTETVTHLRLFDEGDGWAIDGADDTGKYTQEIFKYDTRDEALKHVEEFKAHLQAEGYTLPDGTALVEYKEEESNG